MACAEAEFYKLYYSSLRKSTGPEINGRNYCCHSLNVCFGRLCVVTSIEGTICTSLVLSATQARWQGDPSLSPSRSKRRTKSNSFHCRHCAIIFCSVSRTAYVGAWRRRQLRWKGNETQEASFRTKMCKQLSTSSPHFCLSLPFTLESLSTLRS